MVVVQKTPAEDLEGFTLASGWEIRKKLVKKIGSSGANFGTCYVAERGDEVAFVKAVDFRRAFTAPDFLSAVADLANHAMWEREIMEYCRAHRLSHVVRLVDYEEVLLPSAGGDPTQRVFCLVMEMGQGDLRGEINTRTIVSNAWKLFVARDVALALDQLHRKGIVHLDVKPSNVIVGMERPGGAGADMKLGDLGRVVRKGVSGPFDTKIWPGDPSYSPPEKWYGYTSSQWNNNREAADAYMLGALLVYLFTGASFQALLLNHIPDAYKPGIYRSDFNSALINVLINAQTQVFATYVEPSLPRAVREELLVLIQQLTNPDPEKRGDPKARKQGIVGIDRYHQKFYRMAKRLDFSERARS